MTSVKTALADGRVAANQNNRIRLVRINAPSDTPEHRPRLKPGHKYKATTKFQRDAAGCLLRDINREPQAPDDVMVEVAPNRFVNKAIALALGLICGRRSYIRDAEAKIESYLVPVPHEKDEPFDKSTTPEERAAGRERAAAKAAAERKAITKMRKKFEKRQSIGDPNCRPSENEDFPLLAVLRRDRRDDLIASVMAYRQLVALCESEPLKGQSYDAATGMAVERRSFLRDGVEEVNEAAADGFEGRKSVPGGEIKYRSEIKRSKGTFDLPAKRALPSVATTDGDPIVGRTQSLHTKLNADTLADYIDRKPVLAKIRAALGGLRDPLEDAVLGGRTMQRIGEDEGFRGSAAPSVGKGLVYRGLAILDGFLGSKKYVPANDNYLIENRKIA